MQESLALRSLLSVYFVFQIMMRCSPSGSSEVSGKDYLVLLEAAGISIDDREIAKLDKMTNDEGLIDRKVFKKLSFWYHFTAHVSYSLSYARSFSGF